MKTFAGASIIATAAVAVEKDNLPKLKDKCCTPLSEIKVTKPTQSWICGTLQKKYNQLWGECNTFTTTTMDSLNIADIDATYSDSYTTEYNIENKQIHI